MILLIVIVIIIIIVTSFVIFWRQTRSNPLPLTSFQKNGLCFPCASPVDAQFGDLTFIAAKAIQPNAVRRFFLYNNSDKPMTVHSFTFGGYQRKFGGDVTEWIAPNLMEQYKYTNVVPSGQVFSLDYKNDAHLMYKGWYNSPLFVAYSLGEDSSEYQVLGWMPMRLQDQRVTYEYFYDKETQQNILSKIDPKTTHYDTMKKVLTSRKTFKMVRNACIHWQTGKAIGDAAPLASISQNKNSQCQWVTPLNTFNAVNVQVPLCKLVVRLEKSTKHLQSLDNRVQCLRDIAIIGCSKVMNSSTELANIIELPLPDWKLNQQVMSAIATALWLYVELSSVAVYVIANIINADFPYAGTALSVLYSGMMASTKGVLSTNVLSKVPLAGQILNQIGMEFLNGNKVTKIIEPFLTVAQLALMSALGDTVGGQSDRISDFAGRLITTAIMSSLEYGLDRAADKLKSVLPKGSAPAVDVLKTTLIIINTHTSQNPNSEWNLAFSTIKRKKHADLAKLLTLFSREADKKISKTYLKLAESEEKTEQFFDILVDYTGEVMDAAMIKSTKDLDKYIADQIDIVTTQLLPKAVGKGGEREQYSIGKGGAKYALDRKLWVNRELKRGKFATNAQCSGVWSIVYP